MSVKRLMCFTIFMTAVLAATLLSGCGAAGKAPADTPEPTTTPEPVIISIEVEEQEITAAAALPTLAPTPTPSVTAVPFSYYAPTVNMPYEELVGSSLDDVGKGTKELLKDGYPDPKTYYIIVDKEWQVTMVYKRLDDGTKFGKPNYDEPVRYMLCSSGNPNKEYGHDTTSGIWQIEVPKERFYQFVNLEAAQYLTLIHSRTYFHSVLYKKTKDLSTFLKQSYDDLGSKASHACIRLTVPDACWMYYNIGYGTTCEIRNGDKNDTVTANIRAQLKLPPSKDKVSLKAGGVPWTDNWSIADRGELVLPFKYETPPKPDLGEGDDDTSEVNTTPTPVADPNGGTVVTPAPDPTDSGTVTEAPVVTDPPADTGSGDSTNDLAGQEVIF